MGQRPSEVVARRHIVAGLEERRQDTVPPVTVGPPGLASLTVEILTVVGDVVACPPPFLLRGGAALLETVVAVAVPPPTKIVIDMARPRSVSPPNGDVTIVALVPRRIGPLSEVNGGVPSPVLATKIIP